jgi:stage II sporulation protein D
MLQSKLYALILVMGLLLYADAHSAQTHVSALVQRANEYTAVGRYLEALSFYRDSLRNSISDDDRAAAYFGLALLFDRYLDDCDQAVAYYLRHVELQGAHSARALQYCAAALDRCIRPDEAAAYYRELLVRFPDYAADSGLQDKPAASESGRPDRTSLFSHDRLSGFFGIVRVLIEDDSAPVMIQGVRKLTGAVCGADVSEGHDGVFVFRADTAGLLLNDMLCSPGAVSVHAASDTVLRVNGRPYRSFVTVQAVDGRVQVINHICLEEYLYGVLPREVYVSWPAAVLQAQAVAARTYALYHMIVRQRASYDVLSTTSSQVYGGLEREHPATTAAIDATRDIVLLSCGRLALTLYHANSGGVVEAVEDVWDARLPHLSRVLDIPSLQGRNARWSCSLRADEVSERLAGFGMRLPAPAGMQVLQRSGSGRVEVLELRDSSGRTLILSGNTLRLMLGPGIVKSTRFVVTADDDRFNFTGAGHGHGVGMSQWGACALANEGLDYQAILAHYYPGAETYAWRAAEGPCRAEAR